MVISSQKACSGQVPVFHCIISHSACKGSMRGNRRQQNDQAEIQQQSLKQSIKKNTMLFDDWVSQVSHSVIHTFKEMALVTNTVISVPHFEWINAQKWDPFQSPNRPQTLRISKHPVNCPLEYQVFHFHTLSISHIGWQKAWKVRGFISEPNYYIIPPWSCHPTHAHLLLCHPLQGCLPSGGPAPSCPPRWRRVWLVSCLPRPGWFWTAGSAAPHQFVSLMHGLLGCRLYPWDSNIKREG